MIIIIFSLCIVCYYFGYVVGKDKEKNCEECKYKKKCKYCIYE